MEFDTVLLIKEKTKQLYTIVYYLSCDKQKLYYTPAGAFLSQLLYNTATES